MPIDKLTGTFTLKTRDQDRNDWLESFSFRVPDADVGKDSQPWVDASVSADARAPMWALAGKLADATNWRSATGDTLSEYATQYGRPRQGASGGSGYVICEGATGGGFITAGALGVYRPTGEQFSVTTSGLYLPGDLIPIQGVSTGPQTNVPAGATIQWVSPPPGILGSAKVFENTDGSGISGGANEETDDELVAALEQLFAEPASSGNTAEIIQFVEKLKGIAIQKAFVYPCITGPGVYCVVFTMRPTTAGASRLPNGTHIALVDAALRAQFPGDDGVMVATVLDDLVTPMVKVRWRTDITDWADNAPWPNYAVTPVVVSGAATPTESSARLSNCTVAPTVGKTIAFYDTTTSTFKPKRILTVSLVSGTTYDVTFDLTGGASDPSFVPATGAIVSPWAAGMGIVVEPLLNYVDKQGPGEQVASFVDPGVRQRRDPEPNPSVWPSSISNAILDGIFPLVTDAVLVAPSTPDGTAVGTPGLLSYVHRVSDIGIFPL